MKVKDKDKSYLLLSKKIKIDANIDKCKIDQEKRTRAFRCNIRLKLSFEDHTNVQVRKSKSNIK